MNRRTIIRSVLADPQLRRVELSIVGFGIAENSTWLAITVYAYQRGGVREAGVVSFVQLVPAAILAPFLAFIADRFPRDRVLAVGYAIQAVAFGITAAAMAGNASFIGVYFCAAMAAVMVTVTRPSVAAVLPQLAEVPAGLTAANVVASLAEQTGLFLGPAAAGLLLTGWSPSTVFALGCAVMIVNVAATARLQLRPGASAAIIGESVSATMHELSMGLRLVREDGNTRLLISFVVLIFMLAGALDVAAVAVAIDLLGSSEATAGLLATAIGLGGAVGAGGAVVLVGRRRLTLPLALGVFVSGLAIAATALSLPLALIAGFFALNGAGGAVAEIAGRTMLQGISPDDVLARVFGVLESLTMAALAVGSIAFSFLAVGFGIRGALVIVGLTLPVTLIIRLRSVLAVDAARPDVDPEVLGLVRNVSIFAPLPAYAVEQLLMNFRSASHPPDHLLIREGDEGSLFYLVSRGTAEVELEDGTWLGLGPGDFFGEIALLRNVPRTANVRSGPEGIDVLTLERNVFLEAVTGHSRSLSRAETIADGRRPPDPPR